MKLTGLIIVALLLGTLATHFVMADPGYVVINFRDYIIEMSVPGLIIVLLLLATTAWAILWLLRAPRKLGEAAAHMQGRRAGKRFTRGLIEIAEGNYAKGEKMLTRGASKSDAPLLNYLAAARAAQLQNQDARRDNWLKLAYETQPEASSAVLLTQADLQIAHEQYELAQATLKQLDEQEQGRGQAIVLLAKLYRQLEDWPALGALLPRLRRIGKPGKDTLDEWSIGFHQHRLEETGGINGDVPREWQDIPKALRKNADLRIAYIIALKATDNAELAESELRQMLKTTWHPQLILLYGEIIGGDEGRQLQQAESWLSKHPDDAQLLLTAGRLCMANKLWGKARSYLESSLAIAASPAAFSSYGQLLTQLGESGAAAEAYKKGLTLVAKDPLALPGPGTKD
ncbi:MAG: heme biosynthesis HemY N-terminal domain-containing protein [Pseudomonadota bacterium]